LSLVMKFCCVSKSIVNLIIVSYINQGTSFRLSTFKDTLHTDMYHIVAIYLTVTYPFIVTSVVIGHRTLLVIIVIYEKVNSENENFE
jgi:hypothetical protein